MRTTTSNGVAVVPSQSAECFGASVATDYVTYGIMAGRQPSVRHVDVTQERRAKAETPPARQDLKSPALGLAVLAERRQALLVAVLFVVGLRGVFRVSSRVDRMCPCYMSMVRCFLVLPTFVVLCCFTVVAGSVGKVFLCFFVVLGSFFRHYRSLPGFGEEV